MSEKANDVTEIELRALARDVLGSEEKATAWLKKPVPALEGKIPLSLMADAEGRRAVFAVLIRISDGVFS